ncbi:hypothetical protein [Mycobacterium sp. SMC-4]|uniref:hypothetical protein n=1 Tax=Mycobacterium sp. SMC-4 TaxID=2857059 RepID=UPI003CFF80E4
MEAAVRSEDRRKVRNLGYGIAVLTLCAGLFVAPAESVAWADTTGSGTTSSQSETTSRADETRTERTESDAGSSRRRAAHRSVERSETVGVPQADESVPELDESVPELDDAASPTESEPPASGDTQEKVVARVTPDHVVLQAEPTARRRHAAALEAATPEREERLARRTAIRPERPERTVLPASVPISTLAPVETTRPIPPAPLSPIAELLTLPGRLVNAVLQVLDLTATADRPDRPYGLQPINDLIFGAFREIERLLGLHRPPPPQPEIPTLTYTGPATRPTPTVAQFLNASAAGYVLGGTPGGLVPFTVNGFQMSSTNIFSGMVAKTWVTPEGQLIIAYQGTTGGSHLLFNPLITISQVITDLQVIFTRTTPPAFHHALAFADRVQAAAALQGYTSDDIFVTGHSLGGWEAQFVAQQTGLAGVGFEAPGFNTRVPGNGADSMFVNIGTYGSTAPFMATDLPGLQPFMPRYVPGGGSKPHYGPIILIGDPAAMTPLYNASALWGKGLIGSTIFLVDFLVNFFQYHLPGVQAYHLDVKPDPGMVLFLGTARGPVHTGYGTLTIPELLQRASDDGILFRP